MFGDFISRHAYDRGRRRVNFQTSNIAAFAFDTTEGLYAAVTNLTGRSVNAAPKFSVENDCASHASAEREADDRLAVARRALPHLAQRGRVRIILKQHRPVKRWSQRRRQTKAGQGRNVRRVNEYAGFRMNRSRNNNRDCLNLRASVQACRLTFAYGCDDRDSDAFGWADSGVAVLAPL